MRSFSFHFSTEYNICLLQVLAVVTNFLMRAVATDVEKGCIRTAVGHGSVNPEKKPFPHKQVLLRILMEIGFHTPQPGCENTHGGVEDFGNDCRKGRGDEPSTQILRHSGNGSRIAVLVPFPGQLHCEAWCSFQRPVVVGRRPTQRF